jgi:epimerase transport system membrane fusion protein
MNTLPPTIESGDLDDDRDTRRVGYGIVLVLMAVVLVWGGLAPLQSAAIAPGIVQVEGQRKSIEHLEGGIVAEILVKRGERVSKGQTLLILDATQADAELQIIEGRRYQVTALVQRLEAERDNFEKLSFSEELWRAAEIDQRAQVAMSSQSTLFSARLRDRQGEVEVLEQRVKQISEQLNGLLAIKQSNESVAASLSDEVSDLSALLADGYVDKQRLRELERSRTQVLGEIADIDAQIGGMRAAIGEAKLQVLQLDKRFKTAVIDELTEALGQLYDIEKKHTATSDRVARAVISSPVDGYVLGLATTTVGTVIAPGEQLMEIVPTIDSLVVEARISPMDIDRVRIGQPAEIRFAVFKDAYLVSGELVNLSPDRLIDAATDMPFYAAEVTILKEDMSLLGGMKLVPGMPAEVLIKTGQRTMLGYILSPLNRAVSLSLTED